MPWAVEDLHSNGEHLCTRHTLITMLITPIPAQARTRAVLRPNKQTSTRSSYVWATRTRTGTPLRARRVSRSRLAATSMPFSAALRFMLEELHVARPFRAVHPAVHPGFVPPDPDAGTGALAT
jgi:hypothetical protein